jgi:hypothetical protein
VLLGFMVLLIIWGIEEVLMDVFGIVLVVVIFILLVI